MGEKILTIIAAATAILLSVLLGNGAVWFFNRIPGKWLTDYGLEPSEELMHPTEQRVKSTPWKYVFTGFFIIANFVMLLGRFADIKAMMYVLAADFAMWILIEAAMADAKYMIVPDQLILMLVIVSIGLLPYHARGILDCVVGAGIGLALLGLMALIGKIFYKKSAVGGADVKLFGALGLLTGSDGVIVIFVLSTFISAAHLIYLLIRKKTTLKSSRPAVPYIALASIIYITALHDLLYDFVLTF